MEKRWTGHADPPLTDLGREQAKKACSYFIDFSFQYVTSSGLIRARETATIISKELNIELLDPVLDLNEVYSGPLSGMTGLELIENYPDVMNKWRTGELADIPGGETWEAFGDRVFRGLDYLHELAESILVVAHGGVIRVIEHRLAIKPQKHSNLGGIWVDMSAIGCLSNN